jgi:hypothetical protein
VTDFVDRAPPFVGGAHRRARLSPRLPIIMVSSGIMSSGNGHDPATKQMVEILTKIHAELAALHSDLNAFRDETRGELTDIRGELVAFKDETRTALTEIRADVHAIRGEFIDTRSDHAARIRRLEEAVFKTAAE